MKEKLDAPKRTNHLKTESKRDPGTSKKAELSRVTQLEQRVAELQAEVEKYRLVVDNATDVIWICNMNLEFTYSSPAVAWMRGYTVEESLKQTLPEVMTPESLAVAITAFQEEMALEQDPTVPKDRTRTLLLEEYCRDGSMIWTENTIRFLRDEQGTAIGLIGVTRDVTARKRAEENVQRSEEILRSFIEHSALAVHIVDEDGLVVEWNAASEKMSGMSRAETVGRPLWDILAEMFIDREHVEQKREAARRAIQKALRTGEPVFAGGDNFSIVNRRGERLEIQQVVFPIKTDKGYRFGSLALDITERRRAEEKLAASEARFRLLIQNSNDAVTTLDANGVSFYVSEPIESLTGLPASAWIGRNAFEKMHPDDMPGVMEVFQSGLREPGAVRRVEYRQQHTSGEWRYLEAVGCNLLDDPRVHAVVVNLRDITERKRTEKLMELRLHLTQYAATHTMPELLQETLDRVGDLTGSPIGFFHYVSEDQRSLSLQAWSSRTLREFCQADPSSRHYSIDQAGVWIDCVRERRPLIHNDVASLPNRRGMPTGHAEVVRELLVPIFRGERIVAVMGIGNKANDYTEKDLDTAAYAADIAWEVAERKRIEDAAREGDIMYRSLVENSPMGMHFYQLHDDGRLVFLGSNSAADHFVGLDHTQFVGKTIEEAFPSLIDTEIPARYRDAAAKGIPWSTEQMIYHDNKIAGVFEVRAFQTTPGKMVAVFTEISERRRAEEALRLNAERIEAMLHLNQMEDAPLAEITDYALEAIVRLTKSRIGYLAFYDADERILTMHSWSGSALAECAMVDKPIKYPIDTTGLWGEAVRQRRPIFTNDYQADNPWKRGYPAGHVHIKRHLNLPVFSGGRIVLVAGVGNKEEEYDDNDVNQITLIAEAMWKQIEHKRATEAVRESEERLRRITEQIPSLIFLTDTHGVITYASPAVNEMFRCTEAQMLGRMFTDFLPDEEIPRAMMAFRESMSSAQAVSDFRLTAKRFDGTTFHAELTASPAYKDGVMNGTLGVIRDITERKHAEQERAKLEAQLEQARKLESVGRLAGGVAHDFNNLLTGIMGNISLAMLDLTPGDPLSETLEEINKAAESAAGLTRQLLAFSRRQIVMPKHVSINHIVRNLQKMLRRLIGEDIELVTILPDGIGGALIDPGQVEQIVVNLAVNARDAMPDGGRLTIETSGVELDEAYCASHPDMLPGAYICLAISDTGRGMPPHVLDHIFEPFFTTKELGKGTGLGLATVYGIVKQNRGSVSAYSEVNHGTTFKVFLPRTAEAGEQESAPVRSAMLPGGRETIILVEDEAVVRDLGYKILERLGYKVLAFPSGTAALTAIAKDPHPIQLLITDVIMPGMNGRELADRLRNFYPGLRVLFTSGYTEDVIVHHGILENGINFVSKPFTPEMLATRVRSLLDEKP